MRFCHTVPKLKLLLSVTLMALGYFFAKAQDCPPNIDFENGTFDGWTCYTGYVTGNGVNVINLTPSGPEPGRHTMYSSFPGDGLDYYGGFPVNCPNGSGHSIRLGNDAGGGQAEGISYEFTIPANQDYYNLIYHYAVVFQDPNHEEYQQPRLELEVTNVTDNSVIGCSSFTFVPYGSILPGFFESPNPGSETPVWCKDWTAVSVNLDGLAGKKIRLFFKTADCTFQRHFGYAYLDVNSECSGTFTGATFCPDDVFVNVVAPYGYQSYTWYNNALTQVLGNQQVLTLQPPPPSGTIVAVQLVPYQGYGCPVTLYARLMDTLNIKANAGPDTVSCNHNPVPIGSPPKSGVTYHWSPAAGLTNPNISNPHAAPDVNTTYILSVNHDGGGCFDRDTVTVRASIINDSLFLLGKDMYCIGSGDSAVLKVRSTNQIQWYKDGVSIPGANDTIYKVSQTGYYHALLSNDMGCVVATKKQQVQISSIPVAGISVDAGDQCLVGNKFNFSNTSINQVGNMQYRWTLGDGYSTNTKDIVHIYQKAGVYEVKMIVNSSPICLDSIKMIVRVFQNAIADFEAESVCVNLPMETNNLTIDTLSSPIHYLWDFGNGQTSALRNPEPQFYTRAGTYTVSLSVNTDQCPTPLNTLKRNIVIDQPRQAVNYPLQYAVINYPLVLNARQFGESVFWTPPTFLNDRESYRPVFNGTSDQLYTIEITTASGCLTVDTQYVKAVKEAMIFVPSAFTPNGDGLNDYLRPVFMGIKELHYFKVFNRWGQLVYQSKTDLPGWDGMIGGQPQGPQVFVWMIEGVSIDNRTITQKGTATLVR